MQWANQKMVIISIRIGRSMIYRKHQLQIDPVHCHRFVRAEAAPERQLHR